MSSALMPSPAVRSSTSIFRSPVRCRSSTTLRSWRRRVVLLLIRDAAEVRVDRVDLGRRPSRCSPSPRLRSRRESRPTRPRSARSASPRAASRPAGSSIAATTALEPGVSGARPEVSSVRAKPPFVASREDRGHHLERADALLAVLERLHQRHGPDDACVGHLLLELLLDRSIDVRRQRELDQRVEQPAVGPRGCRRRTSGRGTRACRRLSSRGAETAAGSSRRTDRLRPAAAGCRR